MSSTLTGLGRHVAQLLGRYLRQTKTGRLMIEPRRNSRRAASGPQI